MFDFTIDKEVAQKISHGNGKLGTGVHEVEIEEAFIKNSKAGDPLIDVQIRTADGAVGFLSNLGIVKTWKSGSENFNYGMVMEFLTAAGVEQVKGEPCKRKKNNVEEDAFCVPALKGKKLKVAVYEKFDVYNKEETTQLQLSASFLLDGRTPTEAAQNKEAKVIYKVADRLSDFHSPAWKQWNAAKGGTTAATATSTADTASETAPSAAPGLFDE